MTTTKFKKVVYSAQNKAGAKIELTVDISIASDGTFSANLPVAMRNAVPAAFIDPRRSSAPDKVRVRAPAYKELDDAIRVALNTYIEPEVTQTPVIRYMIKSNVAFAEDANGDIRPNAGWPGARWNQEKMYGQHHARNPAQGYSLSVGARAVMKTVYRYGENEQTEYAGYYKGGSHLEHDNPAKLLNAWCSLSLGPDAKDIPYSDEAAMFFHSLMLGMAEMSRKIQNATFDQEKLLELISLKAPLLSGEPLNDCLDLVDQTPRPPENPAE